MNMMETGTIKLNREELYERVWREPISRIAPQYGISDVGLKKICRKLRIPTPPRGYWAKLQFGQKIKRIPLPKLKGGELSTYEIHRQHKEEKVQEFGPEATEIIEKEKASSGGIRVPKRLTSPHPLVRETRSVLTKAEPDDYGVLRPWRKRYLYIRVGPDSLNRALCIMHALIKEFESRGFPISIKIDGDRHPTTYVEILGEKVQFALREKVRRMEHIPTEKERRDIKRGFPHFVHRWDYTPTGKFALIIDDWGTNGQRKQWSDGRTQTVEDLLHDFLIGAVKFADVKRQKRELREEQQRQWREEQRIREEREQQRRAEEERLRNLELQAQQWTKSQQLRAYIQEVAKLASLRPQSDVFQPDLDRWLSWAKEHAGRLDPLTGGLPFEDFCHVD